MDDYIGGSRVGKWAENAICQQIDPEMFYPELPTPQAIEQAKRVCRKCPVRDDCLAHALENRERYGIWGETTPQDREKIWRQDRLQTRLTALGRTL